MYNYPQQYGQPPGYGAPPGMGAPGMGPPPGVGAAPGMQSPAPSQGNLSQFQPPPNMPNINFNAPVIRLGMGGPPRSDAPLGGMGGRREGNMDSFGGRRGGGLGFDGRDRDSRRDHIRDQMIAIQPPTREEIARTIFVGNITEGCGGDEGMQRLLGIAGGLRRWTRCLDAENKPCSFGFAEYEDADSLGTAAEIFKDVEVPKKKPVAKAIKKEEDDVKMEEDADQAEMTRLLVVIDENSQKYIEEWRNKGSMRDPAEAQFRMDSARDELRGFLASLGRVRVGDVNGNADYDGDIAMNGETKVETATGEIVTIPVTQQEDELSDIPAEMRETVAKEISIFRDRSIRRDVERLRKEKEAESAEKMRAAGPSRYSRLASPPAGTPSGPSGAANGIRGAPLGPRGFQGAQIPQDYRNGVAFVNGSGVNGGFHYSHDEEESDASDDDIERRRKAKKDAELEKLYLDQERKWLNRERSRAAAVDREQQRDREEEKRAERQKAAVAARLKGWNDDVEASKKTEEYYRDRSLWLRNRTAFRAREAAMDSKDRELENREKASKYEHDDPGKLAEQFLAEHVFETRMPANEPAPFKMSLGAAAQKVQAAVAPRRTMAEVEGLLEEEDEEATFTKRTLRPIAMETGNEGARMTEEERAEAVRQLAKDIPSDKQGLWNWPIKWDFIDESVISEQLRPFVERKIMEYLGVQEEMLVDVVETSIKKRGSPQALVTELEGALEEEAEVLVKKLWRMIIFFSESEKRGLSA